MKQLQKFCKEYKINVELVEEFLQEAVAIKKRHPELSADGAILRAFAIRNEFFKAYQNNNQKFLNIVDEMLI